MGITIYKPGEHPYEGLSYQERQLRERQERARKLREHRAREDAFRGKQHRPEYEDKALVAAPETKSDAP